MDVKQRHNISKEIKFCLIFFYFVLVVACTWQDRVQIVKIDYEDEKAVGVTFDTAMDVERIRVFVGEESQTSVIGVIVSAENTHSFTPVIPFTPGQTYTLRKKDTEVLATFRVPKRKERAAAKVLAVYPEADTVPVNLLKMYVEFNQPMQEVGNALDFIRVMNQTTGVETLPFLKLESELWNKERTLLTLWLDPGRIKTDLIPNREKGLPLSEGKRYTVTIDNRWKSAKGGVLEKAYTKEFYVGPRDDQHPDVEKWQVRIQKGASIKRLHIDFGEPMDAFLALETIRIYDLSGTKITGQFNLIENERQLHFVPDAEWESDEIEIRIEARLEDLAGNNLNRLFDTPLGANPEPQDTVKTKSLRILLKE